MVHCLATANTLSQPRAGPKEIPTRHSPGTPGAPSTAHMRCGLLSTKRMCIAPQGTRVGLLYSSRNKTQRTPAHTRPEPNTSPDTSTHHCHNQLLCLPSKPPTKRCWANGPPRFAGQTAQATPNMQRRPNITQSPYSELAQSPHRLQKTAQRENPSQPQPSKAIRPMEHAASTCVTPESCCGDQAKPQPSHLGKRSLL
jgi:hypothetical protein